MRSEPAPFAIWSLDHSRHPGGLWTPHRLRKVTPKQIHVHEDCYESPVIRIPRQKIEIAGEWGRKAEWWRRFYSERRKREMDAEAKRREKAAAARSREAWQRTRTGRYELPVHRHIALLGLPHIFTRDDVLQAFRRLSKHLHPDHGGDPAKFRELIAARDCALTFARTLEAAAV